jgi:hypothetical protein
MAKGGEITSKLAKLMQLLKSAPQEAAPIARAAEPPVSGKAFTPTGRSIPRDDEYERLQGLVTNQPTEAGQHQWAIVKPNGQVHGAPFDFKGSALRIANGLNESLPGHTVQALSVDSPELSRFVPRPDANANPFKKATAQEIDALLSQGDKPAMAEGGQVEAFDPVASARQRVSSSPGSPGISGAIKDAVNALRSYLMTSTQNDVSEDKRQYINSQEGHADGGTIEGPSTEHEAKAGLGKRFGVRLMEQAYGLDASGKPALGGRAWTKGQGGTPAGILDEITAAPHNLLSMVKSIRGLDPARRDPGYRGIQENIDSAIDRVDPQWSRDASDRLEQLRAGMNKQFGVGEAHSLPEHMTDAAASLVTPVPMTKAGESAGLIKRLLEMTTPLRPRTLKNFATDTAGLGVVGTGLDALTERLAKLHAQAGSQGGGASVDPSHFSQDMGLQPEEHEVHNSHEMVPMVTEHGDIYYGVPPETL